MMLFSSTTCLLTFVYLGLTAVILISASPYPAPPPPRCARYECPPYTVLWANNEMEIRDYHSALWVSTPNLPAQSYADGANKGYLILLTYYAGNNRQNQTIDMTSPVLVDVWNSNYKVNFYLPSIYQKNPPPQPFSADIIKLETLPGSKHAAVRRYGGFVSENNIKEQLDALKDGLRGTPYEPAATVDRYTVAGYNSPDEATNRINEIILWFD